MTTDEQLVEEFQRSSRDALAEIFRRYCVKMYGFFRRRTASPARAGGFGEWLFLRFIGRPLDYLQNAVDACWFSCEKR
jgi:hypothetical protein